MFPSLNPTAHLRSDTEMELLFKAVLWETDESQTGPQRAQILTRGLRHCHQTDNHEMSSYAARFMLEEKNIAFLKSAQPISPKLSASLFSPYQEMRVALSSAWQSDDWCRGEEWPLVFPSLTRRQIRPALLDPSHFLHLFCVFFFCMSWIWYFHWQLKPNSSNRAEECSRINVC